MRSRPRMRILLILLLSETVSQVWPAPASQTETDSPFSELMTPAPLPPDDLSEGENSDKTETDAGREETSGPSPSPSPASTSTQPPSSPPAITSSLPQTIYLLSGASLDLNCSATGQPAPSYTWLLDGQEVSHEGAGGQLLVPAVTDSMTGELSCQSTNSQGEDQQSSQVLVVSTTRVSGDINQQIVKNAGESLELLCEVEVDPRIEESVSRLWLKDGLEVEEDSSSHLISYLLADNGGDWRCEVRTVVDTVTIQYEVRVVTESPRVIQLPHTLAGMEGETLQVECRAQGLPAPEISLKLDSSLLTAGPGNITGNTTTATASVTGPGTLTCIAANMYGSHKAELTVQLFRRTIITEGIGSIVANSGEDISLKCEVSLDPRLTASLRRAWLKDSSPVWVSEPRLTVEEGVLTIRAVEKEDEGQYECRVTTEYDGAATSGRLSVLSEAPTFTSVPNNIRLLEGRDKELVCQAAGIPPPLVSWTFNERELESQEGRLELRDVGRSQEGKYLCSATNKYGSLDTEVSVQVIRGLRKENDNLVPDVVKNIKETISLPCDFKVDERVEEETEFIWLKEDSKLDTENSKYSLLPNKSLLIENITLEDPGLYTCNVVTPLQSVRSSIQLIVSGESPEIINNFEKITIHEGETLELSCRARGSPQPRLEWRLGDRPVLSSYLVDVTMANTEYVEKTVRIRGARRGNEGMYQCLATNNVGSVMKNSNVIVIERTRVSIVSHDGPQEISKQAGQKLTLPCTVVTDERNKITDIRWTKADKKIEVGLEDRIDFGYDGSLIIFNVQKRHEGRYRCRVKTQGDEESAEVSLKVIVNAPVITSHSPLQRVFSGSSLELECDANGIPAPEISWTFNKTSTQVRGELYSIRNAISTDSGHYTCIAKNSIGETQQRMEVWVVTVPRLEEVYKLKAGSDLVVPCVRPGPEVSSQWTRANQSLLESDSQGSLVISDLTEDMAGHYSCQIKIAGGDSKIINTEIAIMPDIVLTESKTLTIKEGSNFTLKCDVLPGVNAKRMWKKDGKLVFPSSDTAVDIQEYGRTLVVSQARLEDTGAWTCVATVGQLGRDSLDYQVTVRQSALACSSLSPPTIITITPLNNSTVRLHWQVNKFNASCYETFRIFWWTNETNSEYQRENVALADREKIIGDLKPHTAYFFQVNLVRDSPHNAIQHGNTKSHWMQYFHQTELPTSSSSKAVIIIVVIVIVVLGIILTLLYYKRSQLTDFLLERRKARSGLEFSEYPTKLTANPDFMASLAPTWPEPEPDPTEDQAFIQQQRQLSRRRGSKSSITSSWSSLFNVVSTEDITSEQHYRDSAYRGRSRKE